MILNFVIFVTFVVSIVFLFGCGSATLGPPRQRWLARRLPSFKDHDFVAFRIADADLISRVLNP
jgi:hypothetical protein